MALIGSPDWANGFGNDHVKFGYVNELGTNVLLGIVGANLIFERSGTCGLAKNRFEIEHYGMGNTLKIWYSGGLD